MRGSSRVQISLNQFAFFISALFGSAPHFSILFCSPEHWRTVLLSGREAMVGDYSREEKGQLELSLHSRWPPEITGWGTV